jgi:hypothetical protein
MNRLMAICAVLGMVSAVSSPVMATTVALAPNMLNVAQGQTVTVSVDMYDSPGFAMTALSEIIFYDPSVFTYVDPSVVQGDFLTPAWDLQAAAAIPGEFRLGSFSGGAVLAGAGTVFTFTLQVNADAPLGSSALIWGNGSFQGDGFGYTDADWNDAFLPSTGASINVTPEPMTLALLGLGGLMLRRRMA